jgi:nucleoside-diphosphate-sugar epimerase
MLELGQGFYNTYEQSKYEAELLVHRYKGKGLPVSIFRPSMVMGDSLTGKTTNFRLFYEPLHFFAAGIFDIFPSDHDSLINLININTVSKLLYNLGDQEIDTYHLTSLNDIVPRDLCQMASSFFKFKLPLFESRDKFNEGQWSPVQKKLAVVFIPYFNYKTKFLTRKLERVLLKTESKYTMPVISSKSLNPIFNYCNKAGFIRVRR